MTFILFATALGLSACAAFYSILGLIAIFPSAVISILIMGTLLEVSKLVVASWLYRSWKEIPILMKSYFTVALVILMMLTSMGIFGALSKAHLDQAIPTGDIVAKVSLFDEKIKTEKDNIDVARKQIKQLDAQVDQIIGRSADSQGVERSLQIRRGQQKERNTLLTEISLAQTRIAKLNEERAPAAAAARKVEAEVGPIKYIAALIYADAASEEVLEKAVRWVIIMIVLVFDPLAVLLLVAANWQLHRRQKISVESTIDSSLNLSLSDIVSQSEQINLTEIKKQSETKYSDRVETSNDEELNITIDDTKDWEPILYNRQENINNTLPKKTTTFLNNARSVLSSIGVKNY